jgi:hypothetical protein
MLQHIDLLEIPFPSFQLFVLLAQLRITEVVEQVALRVLLVELAEMVED